MDNLDKWYTCVQCSEYMQFIGRRGGYVYWVCPDGHVIMRVVRAELRIEYFYTGEWLLEGVVSCE